MLAWKSSGHLCGLGPPVWLVADIADGLVFWEGRRGNERELSEKVEGGSRGGLLPGLVSVEVGDGDERCFG